MWTRYLFWILPGIVFVGLLGFGGWLLALPARTSDAAAPQVPEAEVQAMLADLRPVREGRPVIAVIGRNDATETTDYLMPTGILRRANIADVTMVATGPGSVQLYPALRVQPDETIADFDARHPNGADYVIVPAMSRDDDPLVLDWLRAQAEKGARIIGVCAGAKVVAAAGLLDGMRATTHWFYLGEMLDRSPTIRYVPDRRMVSDGAVTTITGIEAIAGRPKAQQVAAGLGLDQWDARHESDAFTLTRPFALTVLGNRMAFWKRDELWLRIDDGVDEVSLALVVDAWSRSYLAGTRTIATSRGAIVSANGVRILPDGVAEPGRQPLAFTQDARPADTLDDTLSAIAGRYGPRTASVVAMELEYPWAGSVF